MPPYCFDLRLQFVTNCACVPFYYPTFRLIERNRGSIDPGLQYCEKLNRNSVVSTVLPSDDGALRGEPCSGIDTETLKNIGQRTQRGYDTLRKSSGSRESTWVFHPYLREGTFARVIARVGTPKSALHVASFLSYAARGCDPTRPPKREQCFIKAGLSMRNFISSKCTIVNAIYGAPRNCHRRRKFAYEYPPLFMNAYSFPSRASSRAVLRRESFPRHSAAFCRHPIVFRIPHVN